MIIGIFNFILFLMNEEHYISKNIKAYYKWRLIFPVLFLVLLSLFSLFFPTLSLLNPKKADLSYDISALYKEKQRFVSLSTDELYFTGYKNDFLGRTTGYYYYGKYNDSLILLLLTPKTSSEGIPKAEDIKTTYEIKPLTPSEKNLLIHLAEDLSWTEQGLLESVSPYFLSEPDGNGIASNLLKYFIIIVTLYSVVIIILYIIYILFPRFSPPVRRLSNFGRPATLLYRAEKELSTLPQLATEDMFITEHFFIETSIYGTAIVPIKEIIWIYKYSTLHKFMHHHFSISYTLHITANKRIYIKCPKNAKTDIDGIIDYLSEANHNILVGFSEENRLRVEAIFQEKDIVRKFFAFLSKTV